MLKVVFGISDGRLGLLGVKDLRGPLHVVRRCLPLGAAEGELIATALCPSPYVESELHGLNRTVLSRRRPSVLRRLAR